MGWDVQVREYVAVDCDTPEGHSMHRDFQVEGHSVYLPLVMKNS